MNNTTANKKRQKWTEKDVVLGEKDVLLAMDNTKTDLRVVKLRSRTPYDFQRYVVYNGAKYRVTIDRHNEDNSCVWKCVWKWRWDHKP